MYIYIAVLCFLGVAAIELYLRKRRSQEEDRLLIKQRIEDFID